MVCRKRISLLPTALSAERRPPAECECKVAENDHLAREKQIAPLDALAQ